jgi:hypothetical protein
VTEELSSIYASKPLYVPKGVALLPLAAGLAYEE